MSVDNSPYHKCAFFSPETGVLSDRDLSKYGHKYIDRIGSRAYCSSGYGQISASCANSCRATDLVCVRVRRNNAVGIDWNDCGSGTGDE